MARRVIWFVGLWLGSVAALALIGQLIRLALSG